MSRDDSDGAAPTRSMATDSEDLAAAARDGAALVEAVRADALELGFSRLAVAAPRASDHVAFYREWLERGLHGEMAYLARDDAVARRADLELTLEGVRSVVVVTHDYHHDDGASPVAPARGIVARYARGRDYHKVVKKKLQRLLSRLDERVEGGVVGRPYVDTGPILERELTQRAGLGWFGRNTMLIDPGRGSYFFVGLLLVDIALPRDEPFVDDRCGSCHACLDACPTGALLGRDETGAPVIDARRCISYLTIELRGPIPLELRPLLGNRVFGCDICQEVCPWNRFAEETTEPAFAARVPRSAPDSGRRRDGRRADARPLPGTDAPPLVDLLRTALDPEAWDDFSRGSPIRRPGRAGFARNVCVAIGNWLSSVEEPAQDALAVLRDALEDDEPLVREHAAWALERAGLPADA